MREVHVRQRNLKKGVMYEYYFEIAPVGGKRQYCTKGGFTSKTAAKEAGKEAQRQYEAYGFVQNKDDISVSDFFDIWLESLTNLKPVTVTNYEKKVRLYIKPEIGKLRLKHIDNSVLQKLIQTLYDKGLSINTLKGITGIITKAFRFAVLNHYLIQTPAIEIKIPTNNPPKGNKGVSNSAPHIVINKEWIDKIFERFPEGHPAHLPLLFGYKCGMRLGEAFAVTWDDIDFEKKEIRIRRQVQWMPDKTKTIEEKQNKVRRYAANENKENGYWYFSTPKYKSNRIVDILDDDFIELLKRTKEQQEKDKEYYGDFYTYYYVAVDENNNPYITTEKTDKPLNPVCVRNNGTYCQPRIMQHTSAVIHSEKFGLKDFDFHSLRHTHATELVNAGAKPEYVQHRLGHKKIEVTMNVYYHLTDDERKKQSELLQMF